MKHRLYVRNPHVASLAAGVLLKRDLRRQQLDEYLAFRAEYLAEQRVVHGDLVCHYCHTGGLLEDVGETPTKAELRKLATLDHVLPQSKGGGTYDKANLVVACYPCNQAKGDRLLFLQ